MSNYNEYLEYLKIQSKATDEAIDSKIAKIKDTLLKEIDAQKLQNSELLKEINAQKQQNAPLQKEIEAQAEQVFERGVAYFKKGDYDAALADFKKAVELRGNHGDYNYRGVTYYKKVNYDAALADFVKAIELNGNGNDYVCRGQTYFEKGDYDAALADFKKAVELRGKAVDYCCCGEVYHKKGDINAARNSYEKALEIDPKYEKAKNALKDIEELARRGTFTDPRDGKVYKTIKIGNQVWMAENLNYNAPDSKCYENDTANAEKYGRLYNWETAKRACPKGWHLPSNEEWDTLVDFAGGYEIAGEHLRAKSGWNSYKDNYKDNSGNGTDKYSFSALPGGLRCPDDGDFMFVGREGYWWGANDGYSYAIHNRDRKIHHYHEGASIGYYNKFYLFSVRCLQD